jgi:hypothetical protein
VAYRVARVDKGQARQLASVALHRICQEKYPERHIETIRLHQEEVQFWTFAAVLKPLEQGQKMLGAPGPVVHIDKVDGHLWQPGEIGTWKGQIFTYGRHKPPSLP